MHSRNDRGSGAEDGRGSLGLLGVAGDGADSREQGVEVLDRPRRITRDGSRCRGAGRAAPGAGQLAANPHSSCDCTKSAQQSPAASRYSPVPMRRNLVTDELWNAIAPLIPREPPKPKGSRPRVPDRTALTGIVFVLRTGIPWEYLPEQFGCSGMTCWRPLRDWARAGVWHRLHIVLLERLEAAGQIDWSRASLDSASVPAKGGEASPRMSARTRRIAASRARSATCWWTAAASRSPCG